MSDLAEWAECLSDAELRQAVGINVIVIREPRAMVMKSQSWARPHLEKAVARLEAVTEELARRGKSG